MPITITELALQHFSLAPADFNAWLNILTDDIIMELPFGPSAGFPAQMKGKDAISKVIPPYFARMPGLTFDHPTVFPSEDPDQAFATYDVDRIVKDNGRRYQQSYVCHFRKRGEKLCYFAEYFDTVKAVAALG